MRGASGTDSTQDQKAQDSRRFHIHPAQGLGFMKYGDRLFYKGLGMILALSFHPGQGSGVRM